MGLHDRPGQLPLPFGGGWSLSQNLVKQHVNLLFFALKPAASAASCMNRAAMQHALGQTRRSAYPEHLLHMTLIPVGGFPTPPRQLIRKIRNVVDEIRARPIPVILDSSAIFGNGKDLVLTSRSRNPALSGFVRGLGDTLRYYGLARGRGGSFTPHVTLIYGCGKIELLPMKQPFAWIADEFMLIYSHYGQTRHEEFGRWNFHADAAPYFPMPRQLPLPF